MAAAMRSLVGALAKSMNRLTGRWRGPEWNDRYAVVVGKSAKQVWHMMNDVRRNAWKAGMEHAIRTRGWDPRTGARASVLMGEGFLTAIFGYSRPVVDGLLWQMISRGVPYTPARSKQQLGLAM